MINQMFDYLRRPSLYAESTAKFWDDEHISKGMLEAHLNTDWDAASRRHSFIDASVEWINNMLPCENYKQLLDLGCGPGLYAERFAEKGFTVTAMDFSKRSIEYAKQKAEENTYNIEYIYQNYLEMEYKDEFDLVTLIYCDFGALSTIQREVLLKKIYTAMKSGGKFIFDVFTPNQYEGKSETNTWELHEGSGFWASDTYLCIEGHFIYEDNTRLNQYAIAHKDGSLNVYRIWDHYYTKDTIQEELIKAGFEKVEVFSDVAGNPYSDKSKTMCLVVEK
jgi:ubiquinone/menaquinone biosynthesis C-methylase UbiE